MEEKVRRVEDRGDRGSRGGDKEDRGGDKGGEKRGFQRRRGCRFCGEGPVIDYKDRFLLGNFVTERFKIVPRRISGNCASHQRELTKAVKRARHVALIPYTTAQM